MPRINDYTQHTSPAHSDVLLIEDLTANTTKKVAVSDLLKVVYPVGAIYISTVATNPNTLFGFGTWVAYATGRTLIGVDADQSEFATAGSTGGTKTHTLSTAEMPAHGHTVNDPGHTHSFTTIQPNSGSSGTTRGTQGPGIGIAAATTGIWLSNTGSGAAHNNLQPYIVTYIWRRSA